jgi:hydroxyacylglutathione hydrolase
MLNIHKFILGPVQTNCYLIGDTSTGNAVVIDPAWASTAVIDIAANMNWKIEAIWLTHAHFDHLGGVRSLRERVASDLKVYLHEHDIDLWRLQGGAPLFGMQFETGPEPGERLTHNQKLMVGEYIFQVYHTPGHTKGHVIFHCPSEKLVFSGDLIFEGGIGRTDLPGGDYPTLINSIRKYILSLPDDTRILCGHGSETSVGQERVHNPFL